ncbi:protein SET-like [Asterias rubens]|uniref:protein SET-like n=1 Tax=Asterias rubens TaxID=7604 RepID=UPI0014555503|nr:protein SET-like [Asterias rubens]XP_033647842.1 protein SET-like [Asterias rubens]XP_033647843.1 protein SET-like [Asterias rubens]XP_033647844.1 protein SET-like [Asterias rubens]
MDGPSPSKQAKIIDSEQSPSETPTTSKPEEPIPSISGGDKDSIEQDDTLEILEQIDNCQGEIENLNESASEEIIRIEERYNRLRKPFTDKRNEFIQKIPNFWICTFVNHPQIAPRLNEEDEECLHYLRRLDIDHYEDLKTGFRITFHFAENPFLENKTICKEFSFSEDGEPTSKCDIIRWKPGMDLTKKVPRKKKSKLEVKCFSFFTWFSDHLDAGNDEIADVIRDDLWSNPLQYYLIPDFDDSMEKSLFTDSYLDSDEDNEVSDEATSPRVSQTTGDNINDSSKRKVGVTPTSNKETS